MPKKHFHEYRQEAANLNATAREKGEPEPIPDYSQLRLRPLARKVLQVRLDNNRGGGKQEDGN